MTKQEAAVITAYTGVVIGEFSDAHKYMEKILERPIFTHELAGKDVISEIKAKSKSDFININIGE